MAFGWDPGQARVNMGGNGEPLAHGRIWSGPLELLLPALGFEALDFHVGDVSELSTECPFPHLTTGSASEWKSIERKSSLRWIM